MEDRRRTEADRGKALIAPGPWDIKKKCNWMRESYPSVRNDANWWRSSVLMRSCEVAAWESKATPAYVMQWGSQRHSDFVMGMKPGIPDPEGSTALENMVLFSESRLKRAQWGKCWYVLQKYLWWQISFTIYLLKTKFPVVIYASIRHFTIKLALLILTVKRDVKGSSHVRMPGLQIVHLPKTSVAISDTTIWKWSYGSFIFMFM